MARAPVGAHNALEAVKGGCEARDDKREDAADFVDDTAEPGCLREVDGTVFGGDRCRAEAVAAGDEPGARRVVGVGDEGDVLDIWESALDGIEFFAGGVAFAQSSDVGGAAGFEVAGGDAGFGEAVAGHVGAGRHEVAVGAKRKGGVETGLENLGGAAVILGGTQNDDWAEFMFH